MLLNRKQKLILIPSLIILSSEVAIAFLNAPKQSKKNASKRTLALRKWQTSKVSEEIKTSLFSKEKESS